MGDEPTVMRGWLRVPGFLDASLRRLDLRRQLGDYLAPKQPASKKRLLEKMHGTICGLQVEVSAEKARIERGSVITLNSRHRIVEAKAIRDNGEEIPLEAKPDRNTGLPNCHFFDDLMVGECKIILRIDWTVQIIKKMAIR